MSDEIKVRVVDSFMTLIGEHDWDDVTLNRVADAADVKLSELRLHFDGKVSILSEFARRIDAIVLDQIDEDVAEELPRERLMDILLSRLDALLPHKPAIKTLMRAMRADLSLAAQINRTSLVSMTWMLNAANIDTAGVEGAIRVQGTAVVFGKVLRTWIDDDESMAKTMAKLDKELRTGERNMRRLDRVSSMLGPLKRFKTRRRTRSAEEILAEEA